MTLKKSYFVEIVAAICTVVLIAYMIFTWKHLTPETEPTAETEASLTVGSEGVDL